MKSLGTDYLNMRSLYKKVVKESFGDELDRIDVGLSGPQKVKNIMSGGPNIQSSDEIESEPFPGDISADTRMSNIMNGSFRESVAQILEKLEQAVNLTKQEIEVVRGILNKAKFEKDEPDE